MKMTNENTRFWLTYCSQRLKIVLTKSLLLLSDMQKDTSKDTNECLKLLRAGQWFWQLISYTWLQIGAVLESLIENWSLGKGVSAISD